MFDIAKTGRFAVITPCAVYQIQAGDVVSSGACTGEGKADVQDLLMEYCKMKSTCEGAFCYVVKTGTLPILSYS